MKLTTYIITIIATVILIFNIIKIDFETPLSKDSFTAVVTSVSAGCTILIVSIIRISLKIRDLVK
jgi:ABC-type Mn2+/Zn2+ transport system permease subunit